MRGPDGRFAAVPRSAGERYKIDHDAGVWRVAYEALWSRYDDYWRALDPLYESRPMVPRDRADAGSSQW